MPSLSYRFDVTPALRWSVQRELQRRSRWYRRMQYAYAALPLVLVGLSLASGRSLTVAVVDNLAWVVGLPLFGFVGLPWLSRWTTARQLRSNPALGGAQAFALTDDGLAMENAAGSTLVRWSALLRVVEAPEHFLFYYSPQCAYYLPRATVPLAELPTVRSFITAHTTVPTDLAA